jgi:hypothetical protein
MGLDGLQAETLIDFDSFLDITKIWGFQKVGPIAELFIAGFVNLSKISAGSRKFS